jgi:hypothetical protein
MARTRCEIARAREIASESWDELSQEALRREVEGWYISFARAGRCDFRWCRICNG